MSMLLKQNRTYAQNLHGKEDKLGVTEPYYLEQIVNKIYLDNYAIKLKPPKLYPSYISLSGSPCY